MRTFLIEETFLAVVFRRRCRSRLCGLSRGARGGDFTLEEDGTRKKREYCAQNDHISQRLSRCFSRYF